MKKCNVCRVTLNNNGYPYILPLNFGMCIKEGKIELYFHGAVEGTKYDLIKKDNRASFEMDCEHKLVTEMERGSCTMEYESVIGQGYIEMLSDDEKYNALCILMKHYHQEDFPFNKSVMPHTKVFKLVIEKVTGKIRMKRSKNYRRIYAWRSDLSKIEIITENQFIEYTKEGYATTFTITAKEPYKRWEFDMENNNMKGHWTGIFLQKDGRSEIDFSEEVIAKKVFMKPFIKAYLKKQQALYISDLQKALS